MSKKCEGLSDYEVKAWIVQLGSFPTERIDHADYSQSYEMDMAHLLKLENGKFALVVEFGCSCYSSEDADIELFPNEKDARVSFDKWVKSTSKRRND